MVALLGRCERPVDGVSDYCSKLSHALRGQGVVLELVDVPWDTRGRLRSALHVWRLGARWRGRWVFVQYTTLMWSRRGFPVWFPLLVFLLRARGAQVAVVFHDIRYDRTRPWFGRLRVCSQYQIMRVAHALAHCSVVTVPARVVPWLPRSPRKVFFIPVGSNIPAASEMIGTTPRASDRNARTVSVFCFSCGSVMHNEVEAIAHAVGQAARIVPVLRLVAFGRGAEAAAPYLRKALEGTGVSVDLKGIVEPAEASRLLLESDVQLLVRGGVSSRRGSALAGIACGIPVVAYSGPETCFPITEAGVALVPESDLGALAESLIRVLEDEDLRQGLRARNLQAYRDWFSWEAIASRLLHALGLGQP